MSSVGPCLKVTLVLESHPENWSLHKQKDAEQPQNLPDSLSPPEKNASEAVIVFPQPVSATVSAHFFSTDQKKQTVI